MTAKKQRSNNDGAVLLTVLTVACFAAILLTAVLSFVGRAHTNAYNNYNSEQAYYIASSALGSIHDYFEEADGSYSKLMTMVNANGNAGTSGTLKFVGDSDNVEISDLISDSNCTVKVSRMGDGYIKVAVTGYCRGQAETINAYYTIQEEKSSGGIDNALYSDGATSLDVCASSNGPFTSRDTYHIRNTTLSRGTIIAGFNFITDAGFTWKTDATGTAKNYIIVGHNLKFHENNVSFIPETLKVSDGSTPDNTSQFIAVGGKFEVDKAPTVIGADFGKDMDVYCNNFHVYGTQGYEQYGNIYCYKMTEDEFKKIHSLQKDDLTKNPCDCVTLDMSTNGLFYLSKNAGKFLVHGNIFVDGAMYFDDKLQAQTIVDGDLYLGADTKITYNAGNFVNGNTSNINFENRFTITKLHAPGMSYQEVAKLVKYGIIKFRGTTAEFAQNIDPDAGDTVLKPLLDPYFDDLTFDNQTPAARGTKPNTDFIDGGYSKSYESTEDYLAKPEHAAIKNAFEVVSNDPATYSIEKNYYEGSAGYTDPDLPGITFDHVIDGPNNGVNGCVINELGQGLDSGERTADNQIERRDRKAILVDLNKIDADYVIVLRDSDRNISLGPNGNPIIIVKNGVMDETTGEWVTGKEPKHNLYIITAKDDNGYYISGQFALYDYYTYKYVIKNDGEKRAINLASYINNDTKVQEGRVFASASENKFTQEGTTTASGVYTPSPTRNYIMLYNDKDALTFSNFDGFVEATLYAPHSYIYMPNSYGVQNPYCLKDVGSDKVQKFNGTDKDARLAVLGAIVCNSFACDDSFGIAFVPPSPDSGIGGSTTTGGTKIEFSHYESR